MNRAVIGILAVVVIHHSARADDFAQMRLPEDITTAADSAYLGELSIIAQLLDTNWWSLNLQTARFEHTFLSRIVNHQTDHPEEWKRAFEGLTWARDSAACHGTAWAPDGEVRWPFFIRFGAPTSWWVSMYQPVGVFRRITVPTYFYWWTPSDTGLACQAESDRDYASQLLTAQPETYELRRPIFPVIEIVSFPNGDATEDVWITVGTNGVELTSPTINRKLLEIVWSIKDAQGLLVAGDRLVHRLGLVGLVLSVTGNRNNIRIPVHFGAERLARGVYELDVQVNGYHMNSGHETVEFTIPSPLASQGMSDLLLVYPRGPRGIDLAPGVGRNGNNFCVVTDPRFFAADTVVPYVEFELPEGDGWTYAVSVFLRPAQRAKGHTVRTGKTVVVADSGEAPIARWAGIDIERELGILGINELPRTNGMSLLAARVYRGDGRMGVFESSFLITPETRLGEYWLTIDVEGANTIGQTFWRSTQKRIAIIRSYASK